MGSGSWGWFSDSNLQKTKLKIFKFNQNAKSNEPKKITEGILKKMIWQY